MLGYQITLPTIPLLILCSANWANPGPYRFTLQAYAGPMEPLIWAAVIIAGHHVPITNVLACAILLVVCSFLVVGIGHVLVSILVPTWWCPRLIVIIPRVAVSFTELAIIC